MGIGPASPKETRGVDWKALMHAVRICNQAEELLLTGNITFPRPESKELLRIRGGELPYKRVAEMIEHGLERVVEAESVSSLPETAQSNVIRTWILGSYGEAVSALFP